MRTPLLIIAFFLMAITAFAQPGNIGIFPQVTASGTDTYTATVTPTFAAYLTGHRFAIAFPNGNTGPASININSKGVKNIVTPEGAALTGGEINNGEILILVYNGTSMQMVGGGGPPPSSSQIVNTVIADQEALQQLAVALVPYLPQQITIPEITGVPTITGTLSVPNILTVTPAAVIGVNVVITYQWERDGTPISGATDITYMLDDPDDFGVDITVVQTATNSAGADVAESAAVTIEGAADTDPPAITAGSITDIQSDRFTVNTTTDEIATHYFIVVPDGSAVPTEAQIIAGVDYGAVTVSSAGSAIGINTNQNSLQLATGLTPETIYDVYRVAVDVAGNQSAIDSDLNVTTDSEEEYIPIPSPPVFSASPTIITAASVGNSLEASELGGDRDILVTATFSDRLRPNQLVGTAESPYRYKSESDVTRSWIGGSNITLGQQAVSSLNGSEHNYFYHLGVEGHPSDAIGGISGFAWGAGTTGKTVKLSDVIIKNTSFAGLHLNTGVNTQFYTTIDGEFVRVINHGIEGESAYLGSTNKLNNFSLINNLRLYCFYSANKGRDGLQLTHILNAAVDKVTIYNVGLDNEGAQRNLIQIHNSNGYIKDGIFDFAPELLNNFTHGFTFENCYFRWTATSMALIGKLTGDATGSAFGPNAAAANNEPVRFVRCVFDPVNFVTTMLNIREDQCNIIFEDCEFSTNVGNIWLDSRVDKITYSITNTGGVDFAPSATTVPTYTNHDPNDEDQHGLVTSAFHKDRGMGYRVKDPSGAVVAPTIQATNLIISNITDTSMDLTWTESDGDGTLILGKSGSAVSSTPSDDINYVASSSFGAGSQIGTLNYVLAKTSGNTVSITDLTPSTTYHYRGSGFNGTGSNVKFITSTATGNPVSGATTAPAAFDPFDDLTWDTALDVATAQADLATNIWTNQGLDGNATVALNPPTWDAAKTAVRFTKADNERFTIQAAGSYNAPVEVWINFITPTAWAGTPNTLCGLSSTHRIAMDATDGEILISGIATGFMPSLDTEYTINVIFNGATSSWEINNGGDNAISLSSAAMGTPTWRLGSNAINTEHFNGWMKYVFLSDAGLTAGQQTEMWTWFGFSMIVLPWRIFRRRKEDEYKIAA